MSRIQLCTSNAGGKLSLSFGRLFDGIRLQAVASLVVFLGVCLAYDCGWCAEPEATPPASNAIETNLQETLRAYLQLQEQLHSAQLAIEQNRKESREASVQNAEFLEGRLRSLEQTIASQRARELEAMQSSDRVIMSVAGTFAAVGFIAMLLMSFFQWRTVSRLAEISGGLAAARGLGPVPAMAALGAGGGPLVTVGPAEQSSLRLLGALEQLEKRIYELEHTTQPPSHEETTGGNGGKASGSLASDNGGRLLTSIDASALGEADRVKMLLGKGESMLHLDDARAAVACFDEVLAIEPNNTEALIRKGTALERLQNLNEAVECYDRAIAADGSLTIAYLHKGGLFNRMERFNEALECYEKALHTQEKRRGG